MYPAMSLLKKGVGYKPEDDYSLVETCSLRITLCNKNNCADLKY